MVEEDSKYRKKDKFSEQLTEDFIFLTSYLDAYQAKLGMYNTQYKPTPIDRYLGLTHNGIIRKVNKIEIDFQNYKEATLELANSMRPSTVVASAKKAKLG